MKKQTNVTTNPEDRALDLFAEMMIAKIESIQSDWKKPWFCEGAMSWPRNLSGREYNGMNAFMLMMLCEKQGYKHPVFMTFDRCQGLNYKPRTNKNDKPVYATDEKGERLPIVHVMKGEKSFPVFITTFTYVHGESKEKIKYDDWKNLSEDERGKYMVFPKLQTYQVFNIDQTNLKDARPQMYKELLAKFGETVKPTVESGDMFCFEAVDKMIEQNLWICPIKQKHGDDCYYSISKNEIVTPEKKQFNCGESFYSNLFHEMAHSTGADNQLCRLKPCSFGSNEYAREELVAEMTAALTASRYGLEKTLKEDSAAYLKSWLRSLKENPQFLKTVLLDVKKAAAMITKVIDDIIMADNKVSDVPAEPEITKKESVSPKVKQFHDMKKKHPDAMLLFRCGDFYETYADDAERAAQVLGITLTRSSKAKDIDGTLLRMAGFPYHALDTYLPKLIRAGARVAICDQIETPAKTAKRGGAKKQKVVEELFANA